MCEKSRSRWINLFLYLGSTILFIWMQQNLEMKSRLTQICKKLLMTRNERERETEEKMNSMNYKDENIN